MEVVSTIEERTTVLVCLPHIAVSAEDSWSDYVANYRNALFINAAKFKWSRIFDPRIDSPNLEWKLVAVSVREDVQDTWLDVPRSRWMVFINMFDYYLIKKRDLSR
jgi:hypothetical protein